MARIHPADSPRGIPISPLHHEVRGERQHQGRRHQDERDRGAERPVVLLDELIVDQRPHHLESRPAEQHRRRIGIHRQDEGEDGAGKHTRHGERKQDAPRHLQRRGAEIERRLLDRAVDALDHALQGEHHERQVHRRDADDDGDLGEHDLERLIDRACARQACVDQPLVAERHHPARGAHRIADEQRQHHQHDQEVLEAHLRARQHVGKRKAHHEADRGGDQRDTHRAREHRVVVDVGEELDVVLHRQRVDHELAGHELVQAVAKQDRERQQDADADVDGGGADERGGGKRAAGSAHAA